MDTILVIENERILGRLYRKELEREGYRVVIASDAKEARSALKTERLDLVVLGMRPPEGEGLEAVACMFAQDRHVPVLLNDGCSQASKYHAVRKLADAWVDKMSDTSELRSKIRELLDARRGQQFSARIPA